MGMVRCGTVIITYIEELPAYSLFRFCDVSPIEKSLLLVHYPRGERVYFL